MVQAPSDSFTLLPPELQELSIRKLLRSDLCHVALTSTALCTFAERHLVRMEREKIEKIRQFTPIFHEYTKTVFPKKEAEFPDFNRNIQDRTESRKAWLELCEQWAVRRKTSYRRFMHFCYTACRC